MLVDMNELVGISQGIFPFLIIIYSIILHEIAHGYAAYIQGDRTAHRAGRLTLNPLPHIDMVGSVIVPCVAFLYFGTFFGWAKPVPYNQYNIRTNLGVAFIASAGILTNLLLALIAGIVFKILLLQGILTPELGKAIFTVISVNISLAFFNLIPIPPFDGMAIIEALFPRVHITRNYAYNPLYMVGAILIASVLYGIFMPPLLGFVSQLLLG
jgi:Zn-dependent protease